MHVAEECVCVWGGDNGGFPLTWLILHLPLATILPQKSQCLFLCLSWGGGRNCDASVGVRCTVAALLLHVHV